MRQAEIVTARAEQVALESGHERFVWYSRNNLSDLVARQGRLEEAVKLAEGALRFFEEIREPVMIGQAKSCLANAWSRLGEGEKVLQIAEEIAAIPPEQLPRDAQERLKEISEWYRAEAKRLLAERRRDVEPTSQLEAAVARNL
jgi:hypothetical protein